MFQEILHYIEKYHPNDKKAFAEKISEKQPYNHFFAKNVFLKEYFPEALAKGDKEKQPGASQIFQDWLSL